MRGIVHDVASREGASSAPRRFIIVYDATFALKRLVTGGGFGLENERLRTLSMDGGTFAIVILPKVY